jgi:uncharacterized protein (TIGR02145 family)
MYYAQYESYPTTSGLNLTTGCPTLPNDDTNYCIKFNSGTTVTYKSDNSNSYDLTFTKNNLTFTVSQSGTIAAGTPAPAEPTLPESDWITIGTQRWARKNLNVGTRINGNQEQTNNGGANVVEKYCYNDDEANCTLNDNGGLYRWNEAMNYSTTEGAQGICPAGSHVPTDVEWTTLETYLGPTNIGTQLLPGGSSGLIIPLGGIGNSGSFGGLSLSAYLWSSSEFNTSALGRYLQSSSGSVGNYNYDKAYGFSIRCLGN